MYTKTMLIGSIRSIRKNNDNSGSIILSTQRPYRSNCHGEIKDYIKIHVWNKYFESLVDYLYEGQLISVEGRIESKVNSSSEKDIENYIFAELILKLTNKNDV